VGQTYKLYAGSRRLDIETTIECHEREVLLRALFPLDARSKTATFETMYGAHERPMHRNTSWDAARFEVSAHRFADISEPGYGVTLLNDGLEEPEEGPVETWGVVSCASRCGPSRS